MPRVLFGILLFVGTAYSLVGAPCATATLTTYLNGGNPFTCEQSSGNIVIAFNHDLLPSYVGLNLLAGNNSAADPNAITVVPERLGCFSPATASLHRIESQARSRNWCTFLSRRSLGS